MRKRKLASILILTLCICFSPVANAACDYETQVKLATEASNVNANYEISEVVYNIDTGEEVTGISEEEIAKDENPYIYRNKVTVYIYNLTENLSVTISGDNGYEDTFTFQESDNGMITFSGDYAEEIVHYTIQVLSANPDCTGDELRTINLTTPKENEYYYYSACEGVDEYFCQQFIDYDLNMTEAELLERANAARNNNNQEEASQEEEEKNWWDNIKEYLNNNPWVIYVTIGGIIVIAGVATAVIVVKKRRSKVL